MVSLAGNMKKNIYFRAKNLVNKLDKETIARRFDIHEADEYSIELLRTFMAISAYKPRFSVLVDVGAYKGLFTKAANNFFKIKQTICIEPNTSHHDLILQNNRGNNLVLDHRALGNKVGKSIYYKHQDSSMNSTVEADEEVLRESFPYDNPDKLTKSKVEITTLDDLLEEMPELNTHKTFLKLDTQGNELDILRGGERFLNNTSLCLVEHMFMKVYRCAYNFNDLITFMYDKGFECVGPISIYWRPSYEVSNADFLFLKKDDE